MSQQHHNIMTPQHHDSHLAINLVINIVRPSAVLTIVMRNGNMDRNIPISFDFRKYVEKHCNGR